MNPSHFQYESLLTRETYVARNEGRFFKVVLRSLNI